LWGSLFDSYISFCLQCSQRQFSNVQCWAEARVGVALSHHQLSSVTQLVVRLRPTERVQLPGYCVSSRAPWPELVTVEQAVGHTAMHIDSDVTPHPEPRSFQSHYIAIAACQFVGHRSFLSHHSLRHGDRSYNGSGTQNPIDCDFCIY